MRSEGLGYVAANSFAEPRQQSRSTPSETAPNQLERSSRGQHLANVSEGIEQEGAEETEGLRAVFGVDESK